jgi:hypothetical protein
VSCAALLTQLEVQPKIHSGMLLGNRGQTFIGSVTSSWGNRDVPNAMEIVSWLLVHGDFPVDGERRDNLIAVARAAIREVRRAGPDIRYEPHPMWFGIQDTTATTDAGFLPELDSCVF